MNNDLANAGPRMQQVIEHFTDELKKIRTGRANAGILEGIQVEVYGQRTPLQHVATINAVDAQLLQITPFDPNNLSAISAAIREDQSLGLNPADDGKVIRVPVPPLTEERRHEIVKHIKEKAEEARISLRNVRHDILNAVKQEEKSGEVSKDDIKETENELNKKIDQFNTQIDSLSKSKEIEVLKV